MESLYCLLFNTALFTFPVTLLITGCLHATHDQSKWLRVVYEVARYACGVSFFLVMILWLLNASIGNPLEFSGDARVYPRDYP